MKQKAFTMAEVLTTLGILGIVMAMTMPNVIKNYQKKQTAVQLKKVYTIMQQATQLAEAEHGPVEYWDFSLSTDDFFDIYIKPYYKKIKTYQTSQIPSDLKITCLKGGDCSSYGGFGNTLKIVLADGTLISFQQISGGNYFTFIIDLNGLKKPNRYGRDVFFFTIQQEGKVLPYGIGKTYGTTIIGQYDRKYLMGTSNARCCNPKKDGLFCAAVIMMDGWEIKQDYPWK